MGKNYLKTISFVSMCAMLLIACGDINNNSGNSINSISTSETIYYTVIFNNDDGSELDRGQVEQGHDAIYNGSTLPSKASTQQYTYTFSSWDKPLFNIQADTTFTAQYSETLNSYLVTFRNYNDTSTLYSKSVSYGSSVTFDSSIEVSKPSTAEYDYEFTGKWLTSKDGETLADLSSVVDTMTVFPQFKAIDVIYTISFMNSDGSTTPLDTETATYGGSVTYHGTTPTKETDAQFSYSFDNQWVTKLDGTEIFDLSNIQYNAKVYPHYVKTSFQDTITFGSYPQSRVTDELIINTLAAMHGDLPTSENNYNWTNCNYYISGEITSYMWYIDLTLDEVNYRGVFFRSYRPNQTSEASVTQNSSQYSNSYFINAVYYFKYEPITWRILAKEGNKTLLMSNIILDAQNYYPLTSQRGSGIDVIYSNNYAESSIRSWLNSNFYKQSFTDEEKLQIKFSTVDNSASTTADNPNVYAHGTTNDKMFLLSFADVHNIYYGFNNDNASYDAKRQIHTSDYAQCQGSQTIHDTTSDYLNCGNWLLRSPSNGDSFIRYVEYRGSNNTAAYNNQSNLGIVPSMWVVLA